MNNCNTNNYPGRNRSRQKQPVYTSDKRAKFTQRENKKWIRFLTVLGYIFFVSMPALSLSFYYIYIWDPGYMTKNDSLGHAGFPAKYIEPIKTDRSIKEAPSTQHSSLQSPTIPNIQTILREGAKSMESSSHEQAIHVNSPR